MLWGHVRDVHALSLVTARDGRRRVLSTGRDGLLKGWAAASDDDEQEAELSINLGSSAERGRGRHRRAVTAKRAGLVEL